MEDSKYAYEEYEDGNGLAGQEAAGDYQTNNGGSRQKAQFNVKANKKFVASGWMGDGQFGKFISFKLRETLEAGTRVFISPRRGNEKILG